MTITDLNHIGTLVRDARRHNGLTQAQLATRLGTSQSAVNRIEAGRQNLSLETIGRISTALGSEILRWGPSDAAHVRVNGGNTLSGSIGVKTSKNAGVALLVASLLNRGRTTLRSVARIAEVERILEVLRSIGVVATWTGGTENDLVIEVPDELRLDDLDVEAAKRTRSIIMFLGPLLHRFREFKLPYAGGCDLGTRTVEPHMLALRHFGLDVVATNEFYRATVDPDAHPERPVVLVERGDTVTENALFAAAGRDAVTVIRNASPNYMVQDLCFYLETLGVVIEGVGTTTLTVHGRSEIDADVEYSPAPDPIEAMTFITAGIVTASEITIERVPIEFLEIELAVLETMGFRYDITDEYPARNGRTRLVDLTTRVSELKAPIDKIHAMPFPGINIDNLPFFTLIAATATGQTTIHDWVYDNRALHLTDLSALGADVRLLDPHRLLVTGPTRWRGAEMVCPPALRPAMVILLAMLAARGTSVLRNIYVIRRGYEDIADRLSSLGADMHAFRDA